MPLMLVTGGLESYVNLQDVGLSEGVLPLLPGDDEKRQEFEKLVKRRGDAVPAQIRALLKKNYEISNELRGDVELEGKIGISQLADDLEAAFKRKK